MTGDVRAAVKNKSAKFHAVAAALSPNILLCVKDIIKNTPADEAYEALKDRKLLVNLQKILSAYKTLLDELAQIVDKIPEVSGDKLTIANVERQDLDLKAFLMEVS
ncbi:hypothetical protein NPIL_594301 [Nephila pilipes]|uniref:DUF7041 domain-containing protein n=1 Tax=Nephila pilipes TaxID=299642 RepID=A0A8X6PGD1_NEPPI|nr:hypothetical protein NPIL_594301 [Nephila pilipes]